MMTAPTTPALKDAPACFTITVRRLALLAGSKAEVAKACNVSERTVGYWRSGKTDKVPFAAVLELARMCDCPIQQVRP